MAHQAVYIAPERNYVRTSKVFDKYKERSSDFIDDENNDFFYKKCRESDLGAVYCFGGWD